MIFSPKKKLTEWLDEGLLNQQQYEAILSFESRGESRSWIIYGITGVGVTSIVTGIISIIAANWNGIPARVKLIAYFLMLSSLGLGFLKTEKEPGVVRESALTLFVLFILAGIGLIAQIPHVDDFNPVKLT